MPRQQPKPELKKLAPRKFKPILDDAPAKELGEYLRAMLRDADITLDRVAAAGGIAKNTLTTTMDGRSKEWPSVQKWIDAYTKAFRAPYTRQMEDIERFYKLGRENHLAARRKPPPGKDALKTAGSHTLKHAAPAAATTALAARLVVDVSIKLPRRTPGAGIDPGAQRFLDEDEIVKRIRQLKDMHHSLGRIRLITHTGEKPLTSEDIAGIDIGPWWTIYRSSHQQGLSKHPRTAHRAAFSRPVSTTPDTSTETSAAIRYAPAPLQHRWELPEPFRQFLLASYPFALLAAGITIIANYALFATVGAAIICIALTILVYRYLRNGER